MAVERIEWRCPECGKRYAIPANLPRPALCPKCQPTEEPEPTIEPEDVAASFVPNENAASVTAPPRRQPVEFDPPPAQPDFKASRFRRKYPALRVISLFYRCLAGVVVLATIVVFVASIAGLFRAENQLERWRFVYMGLGSLVGGAFWSVTLLAFAELIQVALDIEQNTRQQ